ncbi:MAG: hypothetical protein V2I57_14200 [Xanthomonadales bacterium]|jgi:hypothetical protein|nr:hypothetical protein [Xanthomonadales bacterium]
MRIALLAACLIASLSPCGWALAQTAAPPDFPRVVEKDGTRIKVHHPIIDRWVDYAAIEGWIPVEVMERDTGETWIGAVRARARTAVDLDRRLVRLDDAEVLSTRFSDPETPEAIQSLAANAVIGNRSEVMLDEILLSLADDFEPPVPVNDGAGFNRRPPRIVVSESPLNLLLIDQEPVQAPIEGTELDVVVNTNWELFYHRPARLWYVINEGVWQTSSLLSSGSWTSTDRLPGDFESLATGDRWASVREALPARLPAQPPKPLLISLEATELIVIAGPPRLEAIPGTAGLEVVSNAERDLFRLDGLWYFVASGRWFRASELDGDWQAVDTLPEAFAKIPADHGRAHVRRFVPGTLESALAYIEATLPRQTVVSAGSGPGRDVVYYGEPRFEPIPETRLERAVNTPSAVIRHNNAYYLNQEAAWYRASTPTGPWKVTIQVPDEIYAIPPSDPLYPVTFVRPLGNPSRDDEARFAYTEGYNGMYTIDRRVVQGTGWNYRPWVGTWSGYPMYLGYPPTYGWPRYGYWGPRGYWGHWAMYSPPQVLEFESEPRGVGGGPAEPSEMDPRKTRRGYDYSTLTQQRQAGGELSPYLADDLFVDPSGQVYRQTDDGWSRHQDGEWDTMSQLERQYGVSSPQPQAPEGRQRQAYKQNEADIERMERYRERRAKSYNMHSTIYVRQ